MWTISPSPLLQLQMAVMWRLILHPEHGEYNSTQIWEHGEYIHNVHGEYFIFIQNLLNIFFQDQLKQWKMEYFLVVLHEDSNDNEDWRHWNTQCRGKYWKNLFEIAGMLCWTWGLTTVTCATLWMTLGKAFLLQISIGTG